MKQMVFPCGASYELRNSETYPLNGAHVNKDGSIRLVVDGTGLRSPKIAGWPACTLRFRLFEAGTPRQTAARLRGREQARLDHHLPRAAA